MRVFLLGAGASKSYDQSPTGQRMPVARDFFETFDALPISANPWVLIEGLIGYVEETHGRGSAYWYLRSGIDIEDLHSEIEQVRDEGLAADDLEKWYFPYKAYNELVFLFASVLNEIQNGPVSQPHIRLVQQLDPTDIILTFNWDTLLDRALASETRWQPDWGYGVPPHKIFDDGWRDPADAAGQGGHRLIKLHGSTNWLTGYSVMDDHLHIVHSQDLDPGAFAVFEQATAPYACFAGRHMGGYQAYSYGYYPPNLDLPGRRAPEGYEIVALRPQPPWRPEGQAPEDGLPSMPLIIPPVKNKSYTFYGDLFRSLWQQAEDALSVADEIVIIGYSFPRTDTQSDELFRRAFTRRSKMPRIAVLDPEPARIVDKLRDLGLDGDHLTVEPQRFTSDYDLSALIERM